MTRNSDKNRAETPDLTAPVEPGRVPGPADTEAIAEAAAQTPDEGGATPTPEPAEELRVGGPAVIPAAAFENAGLGAAEVRRERAFGEEPDDRTDDDAKTSAPAAEEDEGVKVVYRVKSGDVAAGSHLTLIVPDPAEGYDGLISQGRTYVFHKDQPIRVAEEHVAWLTKHPAYSIEKFSEKENKPISK